MPIAKEKRTKDQVLRLLDRALEQEEALTGKLAALETQLAECRKKMENPRHELDERALPGSKVSFRLDYYRTEKNGPLKGIIEHLPSREQRAFEGNGLEEVGSFASLYTGMPRKPSKRTTDAVSGPVSPPDKPDPEKQRSPLSEKMFPALFESAIEPSMDQPDLLQEPLDSVLFSVLTEGNGRHQRAVRCGEPLLIHIPMQDLSRLQEKLCAVRLSAKPLGNEWAQTLETQETCTPGEEALRIPVRKFPLKQGVYRLMVSIRLPEAPQTACYQKERVLIVR